MIALIAAIVCACLTISPTAQGKSGNQMPELINQVEPVYPIDMKRKGVAGKVVLEFTVDARGKVQSPKVVRSSNPAFDQPAIDAVLKFKFKPGVRNGKPVAVRMRMPIAFNLEDIPPPGVTQADLEFVKKPAMPKGLRCDVTPKVRGEIHPVFPFVCLEASKTGTATVWVLVNASGAVTQMGVIDATAPAFGYAALVACQCAEYDPALLNGKPTDAVLTIKLEFDGSPQMEEVKEREKTISNGSIVPAYKVYDDLQTGVKNGVPFPLVARMANLNEGSATVYLCIDSNGKVILPTPVKSTHPSFEYMAMQAASTWRYPPPTLNGRTVYAFLVMTVKFSTTDTGSTSSITFERGVP